MEAWDVAVVGLGAAGAAATAELASRGHAVLGLDRYEPPHERGSTHGRARMIREAYFEAPFYVPLVQQAAEGWRALERRAGTRLMWRTGGLMLGPPEGSLLSGTRASARAHGLPSEELSAEEVRRRFPAFRPAEDEAAVLEPRAGFLDPEACVRALLAAAREDGAELRTGHRVTGWRGGRTGVVVRTDRGTWRARRLVLAAGPWMPRLLADLGLPLRVERVVQYWFQPRGDARDLRPDRCPVFAWEHAPGRLWYGFPAGEDGLKVGRHYGTPVPGPEAVDRRVAPDEERGMRELVASRMPEAAGPLARATVCLYTMTPDEHFVLDRHPAEPRAVVASACSGHGFKFAPALGRILADLATDVEPSDDLSPFRIDRFAGG